MNTDAAKRHRAHRTAALAELQKSLSSTRTYRTTRQRSSTIPEPDPNKLPDPWLIDSTYFQTELARIRELFQRIPNLRNEQILPQQTAVDAIWRLETQFRDLRGLQHAMQQDFRAKADQLSSSDRQNQHAGRQTETRPVTARRQDSARVA